MVCDVWRNRWRWNLFRETGSCWLRYFNPSKLRVLIGPIADAGRDRDRGVVESVSRDLHALLRYYFLDTPQRHVSHMVQSMNSNLKSIVHA